MTNKKEVAQKVLEAYETSYTESGLVAALRELAFELQYYQCCGDEGAEDMVLDARDVLDVCDELEVMTEEIDISKVLIEGDTATIMGVKYKRIEEPKTPVEQAFKRVYGHYPVSDINDTCWDGKIWIDFEKGYNAAQKDYKVGEYQEPEELKTLYQMLDDKYCPDACAFVCDIVKEWMSQYTHNVMSGEYLKGYEECLTVLEENLK